MPLAVAPPISEGGEREQKPEQSTRQVNPDSILHALDILIALSPLVDEQLDMSSASLLQLIGLNRTMYLSKNAKERNPQDKEDEVPYPDDSKPKYEGNEVEKCRDG